MSGHLNIMAYAHPQLIASVYLSHDAFCLTSEETDIYLLALQQLPYIYLLMEDLKGILGDGQISLFCFN